MGSGAERGGIIHCLKERSIVLERERLEAAAAMKASVLITSRSKEKARFWPVTKATKGSTSLTTQFGLLKKTEPLHLLIDLG